MYEAYPGCSNQNTSCSSTDSIRSKESHENFHPVYEEVSGVSNDKRGVSVDSDIDDTDIEPDSVASEDEFAEDELSLADFPKDEADEVMNNGRNSSLGRRLGRGTTPTENRNFSDSLPPSNSSNKKRTKNNRGMDRNFDGYPSDTLRAKHNYYVSKDKMAPDLYGTNYSTNRKGSSNPGNHYPSKNSNHNNSQPRTSRGNYNRNSSGSGGSAVNSHSTGTPPYNDNRFTDPRLGAQFAPSGPITPNYYTSGNRGRNPGDNLDFRQASLPHHQHSRATPDGMYNRMPGDVLSELNQKMQNPPGHRPDQHPRHSNQSPYAYGRKQQTPTDHRDLNFQPQRKMTPIASNNHFNPGFNDPEGPFTIDGSNPHVNPSVASHPGEKSYGSPVTSGGPSVSYPSGQNSSNAGQTENGDVLQEDEPIYNELDPVYAQRPLYT